MTVNDWYNGRYYFFKLSILSPDELIIIWRFTRTIDTTYGWRYWTLSDNEVRFAKSLFYENLDLKIEFLKIVGIIESRIEKQNLQRSVEDNMLMKQKNHYDDMKI